MFTDLETEQRRSSYNVDELFSISYVYRRKLRVSVAEHHIAGHIQITLLSLEKLELQFLD